MGSTLRRSEAGGGARSPRNAYDKGNVTVTGPICATLPGRYSPAPARYCKHSALPACTRRHGAGRW